MGDGDYDAIYFGIEFDSFDPGRSAEYLAELRLLPSLESRASETGDAVGSGDRRSDPETVARRSTPLSGTSCLAAAAAIFAEHLPIVYFASPKVIVATSARLRGAEPSVLPPPVLWNAEALSIAGAGGRK